MVKNILSLLLGLSILGYGGYHSIKLASLSKPKFVSSNSNIDLSEEKWVKPPPPPKPQIQAAASPPVVKKPTKSKSKKAAPKKTESCELGSNTGAGGRRIRVEVKGGTLQCKKRSQ